MADNLDWLTALLNPQWQGGGIAAAPQRIGDPAAFDPNNPVTGGGLLAGAMPPALGGLLTRPRPAPAYPEADAANEGRSVAPVSSQASAGPAITQGGAYATDGLTAPAANRNSNVVGTPASGTTEASSPGFLSKLGTVLGGIYGQGGPGDSLIQLGAGLASPEGWAKGVTNATNAMGNNALRQAQLKAFNLQIAQQQDSQNKTRAWLQSVKGPDGKGLTPEAIDAAMSQNLAGNPAMLNSYFKQYGEPDKYTPVQTPAGPKLINRFDPTDIKDIPLGNGGQPINSPLTNPDQRAKYGISPDDRAPYSLNMATGKVEAVGGGGTKIYNAPEESYTAGLTKALTKTHADLAGGVEASQSRSRDIAAMQGALARIQAAGGTTGLGQEEKIKLQGLLNSGANAIGLSEPFDISDPQLLSKFNRQLAGGQAKDVGGARVTNFEMQNFLQSNAGLALSPTANQRLLGIQSQIEDRNQNVGMQIRQMTADALQNGRQVNPGDVEKVIRGYDAAHHISDPITGQDLTKNAKLMDLQNPPTTETGAPIAGMNKGATGPRKAPSWSIIQ